RARTEPAPDGPSDQPSPTAELAEQPASSELGEEVGPNPAPQLFGGALVQRRDLAVRSGFLSPGRKAARHDAGLGLCRCDELIRGHGPVCRPAMETNRVEGGGDDKP